VQTAEIVGVTFRNSAQFHMNLHDVDSIYIHDLEIYVDILKQRDLMSPFSSNPLFNFMKNTLGPSIG
jgi:hypothetical protein